MSDHNVSHDNARKLDRLLDLVQGAQDAPGLLGRLALVERVLFGQDNSGGMVSQHQTLWKIHKWLIGLVGVAMGALITLAVEKLSKYL